jgi:hypothetical protein
MQREDVFGIVGSVVAGAYQVQAVVAQGGFGVVYRAHHSGFRAPVALKCLRIPRQLDRRRQAQFLEQFRAEAELLFRLSASIPTVVRPLGIDAITTPQGVFVPFMALEWLDGKTLQQAAAERRAAGQPIDLPELVALLTPVARALEKAHRFVGPAGPVCIVHRDLKPENIFLANVAGEQIIKIVDFGIAKAMSVASQVAGQASQSPDAAAAFTPAYAAPEQWMPDRFGQTGPWTDVWGLALTMVEVLVGHPIIAGDHAGMMGTAIDPVRRPTLRTEGLSVSDAVEAVFVRALAVDPRQRQQDAAVFWSELVAAVGAGEPYGAQRAAPAAVQGGGATPPAIPDLEVMAAPAQKPQSLAQAPMSVMDMDEFGVEQQGLQLDLDLPEGEPVSLRVPGAEPARPDSAEVDVSPVETAAEGAAPSEGDAATAGAAPDEAERPATATELWERAVELARGVWDEDAPLGLQLFPGILLVALALVVTVADQLYAVATDEVFSVGPVRAGWFAGLLLIGGIGLVVYRIVLRYR